MNDIGHDYSIAPNDVNLKRIWNLGRTMEHEYLGHVISELDDWSDYTQTGWGESEFRNSRYGKRKTALQLVNDFRIEMGLENYQRLHYSTSNYTPIVIFGNPNEPHGTLFPIQTK